MQPSKFSHKRYLKTIFRKLVFFYSTSTPFISQDFFAKIVDYAPWHSEFHKFDLAFRSLFLRREKAMKPRISSRKLRKAKSLFIPSHELENFVALHGKEVNAKIILCGSSDFNFIQKPTLPLSIDLCLFQNSAISDDDFIYTLPIGLENLSLGRSGMKKYHKFQESFRWTDRILVPPMSPTNVARYEVLLWAKNNPELADVRYQLLEVDEYFRLTKEYKFIFCCEGNGFENHRIWETLYQGSFPVMLKSDWSKSLDYLKLPILFVNTVEELNRQILIEHSARNRNFHPNACAPLWSPYWKEWINRALNNA
jgi:hypothetical protein